MSKQPLSAYEQTLALCKNPSKIVELVPKNICCVSGHKVVHHNLLRHLQTIILTPLLMHKTEELCET